jgi:hypothetical protein
MTPASEDICQRDVHLGVMRGRGAHTSSESGEFLSKSK